MICARALKTEARMQWSKTCSRRGRCRLCDCSDRKSSLTRYKRHAQVLHNIRFAGVAGGALATWSAGGSRPPHGAARMDMHGLGRAPPRRTVYPTVEHRERPLEKCQHTPFLSVSRPARTLELDKLASTTPLTKTKPVAKTTAATTPPAEAFGAREASDNRCTSTPRGEGIKSPRKCARGYQS